MNIKMEFTAKATCPKDGETIEMAVAIRSEKFLLVEDVLAHVARITSAPVYQEQFTDQLLRAIGSYRHDPVTDARIWDVSVTTIGRHSGVDITCSA